MRLRFNEAKATEAAARLIELRGGKMSYMKLIKLLYLADREALLRWGRPMTTDRYLSMDHGPVVSNVYEIIRAEPQPAKGAILAALRVGARREPRRQFARQPRAIRAVRGRGIAPP